MLGEAMWMILQQVPKARLTRLTRIMKDRSFGMSERRGVPRDWKDVVGDSVREDPNERPGLEGLREYWGRMERIMRVAEESC